jgi:hypothetical protein
MRALSHGLGYDSDHVFWGQESPQTHAKTAKLLLISVVIRKKTRESQPSLLFGVTPSKRKVERSFQSLLCWFLVATDAPSPPWEL